MSQPATAAIVVGSIVGGVAFIFVSYKLYVKYYHARHQGPMVLPPAREPQDYASQYLTPSTNAMAGTLYGGEGSYQNSWKGSGSHSKASVTSHIERAYGSEHSFPYHAQRTSSSSQGLLAHSPSAVAMPGEYLSPPSPISDAPNGSPLMTATPPSEAYEPVQHNRQSSRPPTTMMKRTYATSVKSSSAGSSHPSGLRRESYLPHLPENRDQIQIVPPQPLGFGLGGMATALDQKTLAFSSTSGIGSGEDDFSRGLVWQEGNPDATAQAQRASRLGEDERLRYLAQGPRVLSPSIRGAVHNHIYAGSNAGSSGMRTPEVPSSRSRSPAAIGPWDGSSSSDVGPSVSQRGTISPSQPLSHPLEDTHSIPSTHSQTARNTALTNMQSPLALMSGAHATPSPQKEMTRDSPILGAFRNPVSNQPLPQPDYSGVESGSHSHSNSQNSGSAASGYLHGERTPGLVNGSISTGHGSSDRQSAHGSQAQHDSFAIDEEKRMAIGKIGQVRVIGVDAELAPTPNAKDTENKQSKGWRLGRLMGAKS